MPKKSSKIHAYNKRHLIINGLQRGLWRRPACQSIFLQAPSHQLLRIPLRHTQPNVRNAEWDSRRGFQKSPSEQVDKERAEQITIRPQKKRFSTDKPLNSNNLYYTEKG